MTKLTLFKQLGWAALSACLSVSAFLSAAPSIRSEQIGVTWPSGARLLLASALMFAGLAISGRAGQVRYVSYLVLAACFAAYVLGVQWVLKLAGA